MTIEYDEKGKIFTNIIQKNPLPATIQTLNNLMKGTIYVRRGERLKDELDRCNRFVPVTEAKVLSLSGDVLYSSNFVAINLDHIVWIIPDEEMSQVVE